MNRKIQLVTIFLITLLSVQFIIGDSVCSESLSRVSSLSHVDAANRNISEYVLRKDMMKRKEKITYSMDETDVKYVKKQPSDEIPYFKEAISLPDPTGEAGDYLAFTVKEARIDGNYTSDGKGELNYNIVYMTTYEQETQLTTLAQSIAKEVEGKSDFDKARYIHDYICQQGSYDTSYTRYDAYNLLFNKSAVCQGYALAFYRLARAAKLDCRIVTGKASGDRVVNGTIQEGNVSTGDNHAWNVVRVDGQWYNVDVTWDDQEKVSYDFFLKNEADFSPDGTKHERNAKYTGINIAPISVDLSNPPGGSTPLVDEEVREPKEKKSSVSKSETKTTTTTVSIDAKGIAKMIWSAFLAFLAFLAKIIIAIAQFIIGIFKAIFG